MRIPPRPTARTVGRASRRFLGTSQRCVCTRQGGRRRKRGGKLKKKKKKAAFNAVIWVQVSRLFPLPQGLERRWTPPDSREVSPALSPARCPSFAPCPGYNAPRLSLPLPPTHRPWLWEGAASIPEHLWSPPGRGQRGHWDSREVRRGILRVSLLFYLFYFLRGFFFSCEMLNSPSRSPLCQVLLGTRCTHGPGKSENPIPSCSWQSWRGSLWSMNSLLAKEGGSSQTD